MSSTDLNTPTAYIIFGLDGCARLGNIKNMHQDKKNAYTPFCFNNTDGRQYYFTCSCCFYQVIHSVHLLH